MRCTMNTTLILWAAVLLHEPPTASAQHYQDYADPDALVDSWYRAYLGRSGRGDTGTIGWANQLRDGLSPETVQASILGSEEYYARSGSSIDGFVRNLYRDVAGQRPNRREHQFWVRRAYTQSREDIAYDFLLQHSQGIAPSVSDFVPGGYDYRRPPYPYRR